MTLELQLDAMAGFAGRTVRQFMRQYKDIAGNPCTLEWLVRNEPEWAANQIRHRDLESARLDALERMGNIGIWRGSWAEHMGEKAGKPIVEINEMDDDGEEKLDHLATAETLREAIDIILSNTEVSNTGANTET